MSGASSTNYKETHFEYTELTKIRGQPTYEAIEQMHKELKANAQSVFSRLGGGNFGHLGLVLSNAQYATVSPTSFVKPQTPTPPVIQQFAITSEIARLQQEYNENLRSFNEVNSVEKALRQQIVSAVDATYMAALRNRATNAINYSVTEILDYLYKTYGKITPQMLDTQESKVKSLIFDPSQPLTLIINPIEDLMDYATAARSPYTEIQLINMGYNIINRSGMLKEGIKTWIRTPIAQKSWLNFKTHFNEALSEWREITDTSVQDSRFNHANFVQEVIDGLSDQLNIPAEDESEEAMQNMANAMTQNAQCIPTLLAQMQQMQTTIANLQESMANNSNNNNNNSNNGGRTQRQRRNTAKYCWSHGACAHKSAECTKIRDGHKVDATMANKMGGSTRYCDTT